MASLVTDRKLRAGVAGTEVEALVNSDHYIVLGCLSSASLTEHKRYLGGEETVAGEAAGETNTGRSTFCGPTEGLPESATTQGKTKRLDLRGDVEACRRESLRTPGPTVWAGV